MAIPLSYIDMSYENMKAKQKNLIRERSYYSYLLVCLSSAFEWSIPKGVEPKYLEEYLHEGGAFAVQKKDDTYYVVPSPSRAGKLDQYGDGTEIYGVTRGGVAQIQGTYNKDVAICYNNLDRMADLDIVRYADAFSQVDKSIMSNIRWSILAPALCASNSKTASAIDKLVDDMLDGKLKCITSEDVLESLSGGGRGVYSVDITHPERIKNVQYQSELYDVLFRRFFNKYGLNIQNTSKHAQATTDEVHGLDSVSWVYILDMLKQRQRFCEEINAITGDNWSCKFSDLWETEYKKYKAEAKQPVAELEETKSEATDDTAAAESEEENVEDLEQN